MKGVYFSLMFLSQWLCGYYMYLKDFIVLDKAELHLVVVFLIRTWTTYYGLNVSVRTSCPVLYLNLSKCSQNERTWLQLVDSVPPNICLSSVCVSVCANACWSNKGSKCMVDQHRIICQKEPRFTKSITIHVDCINKTCRCMLTWYHCHAPVNLQISKTTKATLS